MMKLRLYQQEAIDAFLLDRQEGGTAGLIVAPTGTGKTVIFAEAVRSIHAETGKRCIVLAHREELVYQAAKKIRAATGLAVGIEMAEQRANHSWIGRDEVVVASTASLIHRYRTYQPDQFGLIVSDEAHHSVAPGWKKCIDYFHAGNPTLYHLGVTATPDRGDGVALLHVFDKNVYTYTLRNALEDGWLVPIHQTFVNIVGLNVSNVKTRGGDFVESELQEVTESHTRAMVNEIAIRLRGRRCIAFAVSVKQSKEAAECFLDDHGIVAAHVDGNTPTEKRKEIFDSFGAGATQVLCNVGIATEGWDDPANDGRGVQVVAMMRMTQSRALYAQMLGRGTRSLPETLLGLDGASSEARRRAIAESAKTNVEVIDMVGVTGKHKLVHAIDVLGGSTEKLEAIRDRRKKEGVAKVDILDELRAIEQEQKEREARAIRQKVRTENKLIVTAKEVSVDPWKHYSVVPAKLEGWRYQKKATDKQAAILEERGIPNAKMMPSAHASQLIDAIFSRPTDKQMAVLKRAGYAEHEIKSIGQKGASALIDRVKSNGWKRVPIEDKSEAPF